MFILGLLFSLFVVSTQPAPYIDREPASVDWPGYEIIDCSNGACD